MHWTEERVTQLKNFWQSGLSASQIARSLGGVTRNAVIGKVHRLGLSGRAKSVKSDPQKETVSNVTYISRGVDSEAENSKKSSGSAYCVAETQIVEKKTDKMPAQDTESSPKTILELTEYTCKWPVGEPGSEEFHFCGKLSCSGLPYCEHHARKAYQPVYERRRERSSFSA